MIPPFKRAAVIVRCKGKRLLLLEIPLSIVEQKCIKATKEVMKLLQSVLFYISIADLLAKPSLYQSR